MNTTTILSNTATRRMSLIVVKWFLAITAGTVIALCATFSASAQTATTAPVGLVADITTKLLSAPLTTAQRQALHAQNFYSMPTDTRPVYLHSVAYAIGYTVASRGQLPSSEVLMNHLKTVLGTSIYAIPAVWHDDWLAPVLVVHDRLKTLNFLISTQVANSPSYQQAMYAGTLDSFSDEITEITTGAEPWN
jgi:hypothetical protein